MKKRVGEIYIQCNGAYAGTETDPTWHVRIINEAENMEEVAAQGALSVERTLNMTQCEEEGIKLPDCFEQTTVDVMKRAERAELQLTDAMEKIIQLELSLEVARTRATKAESDLVRLAGLVIG